MCVQGSRKPTSQSLHICGGGEGCFLSPKALNLDTDQNTVYS